MDGDKLKPSALFIQIVVAIVFSSLAVQTGFVIAWPSYNVANFLSNNTVLEKPMSSLDISLLGGLPNLGGLVAMPVCGWAFNTLGRKYGTMFLSLPFVISWVMIALTNNITLILIAVTIAGAGIAGQNISNVYISEVSHVSIRGAMISSTSCGFIVGILISYMMGGYLQYMTVVLIHLITCVLTILLFAFLPDSPVYLVMVGKDEEAAKSLSFYRRYDVKSKEVEAEILQIKLSINPKLEALLPEIVQDPETADKLLEKQDVNNETENISSWRFLMKSKSSKRVLATTLIITALTISMGGSVLQVFAEPLFAEAVPSMSPNQCAIFVALDSLVASIVCLFIIDKYGRKSAFMSTSTVAALCAGLLGTQLQFHWAPQWLTVVLIYVYGFVFTAGCGVIPFVLASEVFLPEVRSLCNSFCYSFVWIFSFITLFIFNPLVASMGLGFVFYIFCFMCVAGTVYVYYYLPETKGLSVDMIQVDFLKKSGFKRRQ